LKKGRINSMQNAKLSVPEPVPATRLGAPLLVASWLAVGLPLAWGVSQTLRQALSLFD
jgi:hypothetical protein